MILSMRSLLAGLTAIVLLACSAGASSTGQAPAASGVGTPSSTPATSAPVTTSPNLTAAASPMASAGSTPLATPAPTPSTAVITITATAATGSGVIQPGTPGPPPKPTPTPTLPRLALVDLRYRLVDEIGRPLFCDPDFYPVARADETELAVSRYPEIRADAPTYAAIAAHLQISGSGDPSAAQKLAIYREWKALNALVLTPTGAAYSFDYVAADAPDAKSGTHVTGTVDASGAITVSTREPSGPPMCPICLARGTRIDTPTGPVAVEDLRVGMTVWTSDGAGGRHAARLIAVGSTPVPSTHRVVHLVLADGRILDVSPGHPLADGRPVGSVRAGDVLDGAVVVSIALRPYAGRATFDVLPAGPTGTYWANGILIGSTLKSRLSSAG
jgi:hypothetical protein